MKLKELRNNRNLNQAEVAMALKISQKTYCNYELGKTEPNVKTLIKLADFFDVTIDYLVDRQFSNKYIYLTEDEQKIIDIYRNTISNKS